MTGNAIEIRTNELEQIHDRLHRASDHMDALKSQLLSFYGSDFTGMSGRYDPGTNQVTLDSGNITFLTYPRLNTVFGEFLHNLQSALDHLAWELVLKNGGKPKELKTAFPILAPEQFSKEKEVLPDVAGGASDKARKIIHEAQPYMWDDSYSKHPLYILRRLWNIDKHRHVPIGSLSIKQIISQSNMPGFSFHFETASFDKFGVRVAAVPDDSSLKVKLETTIELSILEPVQIAVLEFSEQAYCAVKKIVADCERDCL